MTESPEDFCALIRNLSPRERQDQLKRILATDLGPPVRKLLEDSEWAEFMRLEKTTELQVNLKSLVTLESLQALAERDAKGEPSGLRALVQDWIPGDEFWLFDSVPGDKGYALVRDGQIVSFEIVEVSCCNVSP